MRNKVFDVELEMNLEFESYELKCSKSSFFFQFRFHLGLVLFDCVVQKTFSFIENNYSPLGGRVRVSINIGRAMDAILK